ncbi:NnrS family protein [Halovibrio salipaludis]|uniref:NnrS family protein n=2 Tax=Halovibrio salipaludis TaxID=2032626 RepID=A0A2A2F8N1_9GAMM|nr:NnrS family protein [Halovibrio salipaludis]
MLHEMERASYRPFFFLSGVAAIGGGLVWSAPVANPVLLHMHLLLFGMGTAAVAGYLLTALPSWAGREPIPTWLIRALVVLWLGARAGGFVAESVPWSLVVAPGVMFGALLAGFLLYRVCGAAAWPRVHLSLIPLLPALAEVLVMQGGSWPSSQDTVMAGLVFALLIMLIGGRAVPAFTVTGLELRGLPSRVYAPPGLQWISVAGLAVTLGALVVSVPDRWIGSFLLLLGVLQFFRLVGWRPWQVWRVWPLLMLQLAWAWLVVGLVLLGAAFFGVGGLLSGDALHALTIGAMGGMILAFASRVAMPRDSQGLEASVPQFTAMVLISLAALARVSPEFTGPIDNLWLASLCWTGGWILFLWALAPALCGAVPHPVLSGHRGGAQKSLNGDAASGTH